MVAAACVAVAKGGDGEGGSVHAVVQRQVGQASTRYLTLSLGGRQWQRARNANGRTRWRRHSWRHRGAAQWAESGGGLVDRYPLDDWRRERRGGGGRRNGDGEAALGGVLWLGESGPMDR